MLMDNMLALYIELIAKILKKLKFRFTGTGIELSFDTGTEASIDERIIKIDQARANLVDGLKAIDELRTSAEENKKEVQIALEQFAQLEEDKRALQEKLQSVKQIIKTDVTAFREVAGVPSPADIRRQRVIGFISGVIASILASGIIYGAAKVIGYLTKITNGST